MIGTRALLAVGAVSASISLPALADGWASFVDQTATRLVAAPALGSLDPEEKDFAYADLDNDGDVDLIVVRKQPFTVDVGKRNVLLMNEGGTLVDRTLQFAVAATDGGQGFLDITNDRDVAIGDFNNDGWLDFVTCPALNQSLPKTISHPRVYMNLGNGGGGAWLGFRYEESRIPQLPTAPNGCGIATGDLTGDGFADIYLVDYLSSQEDRLFVNNGQGFFTDQTASRMTAEMISSDFGTAGAIVDMNGDGAKDVVKSENGPFKATYNNPAQVGVFNKHETASGGSHYGMSVGDLNNDGKVDVVLGDDGADRYLLNLGNGADGMADFLSNTFSFQSGGDDGFGNNSRVVDLNNDGFNDVLICDVDVDIGGCDRRMHLYRNLGNVPNVTLQDQGTCGIPESELQGSHDVAVFDLDGDGWKDIVIGRCAGIRVWMNVPPLGALVTYPQGLPATLTPNQPTPFQVKVSPFGGSGVVAGSVKLHYMDPVTQVEVTNTLSPIGGDAYQATLPGAPCTEQVDWWVTAQLTPGNTALADPPGAPESRYSALSALGLDITLRDEFEDASGGWSVSNDASLTGGGWVLANPVGAIANGQLVAPEDDATSGTGARCYVTGNGAIGGVASASDVDNGPTSLLSKVFDLQGQDALISFAAWFYCDDAGATGADVLSVDISNDSGSTWTVVRTIAGTGNAWQTQVFRVSEFIEPTAGMRVRFRAQDASNNSLTEAGIDNFQIQTVLCPDACLGDLNGDGSVDGGDLGVLLSAWGVAAGGSSADLNGDNSVDGGDLGVLLSAWGTCP